MIISKIMMKGIAILGILLMIAASMGACSSTTSWKEEVQLHDGNKIIAERTVSRGGRHEIGQKPAYKEQSLSLTLPGSNQNIIWKDTYSTDIGSASFLPMLVDVHKGTAYLVANTMGCLSYNKWGRPNPPYVIFKHDGKAWQHIPLQDLPAEINTPNLISSMPDIMVERMGKSFVEAETIQKIIRGYQQPEYKTILREALSRDRCPQYSSGPKAPTPISPGISPN